MKRHPSVLSMSAAFVLGASLAASPALPAASHAAKVVYAIGEVSAADAGGTRRTLGRGDLIAPGDTVVTGKGRAQLRLTDGGFIALNPGTEYAIEEYSYDEANASSSRSFFNLVKGGVRLITGAVGRVNRNGWRMRTAVATIGIRGSEGYFRLLEDELLVTVADGGFTATDPDTGEQSDLGPGNYRCSSPCKPIDGAGEREDLSYYEPDDRVYESGEDQAGGGSAEGPIPAGPAPDGTHVSVAFSFTEPNPSFPSFGPMAFLNSIADGEETDGMVNIAEFASLEMFEWFTSFPCEPCIFTRNQAQEIVDPATDGSTFNTELSAEWGRIIDGWNVQDSSGNHTYVGHFHWVASTNPTPDANLPSSGVMVYKRDVGGTLATHEFGVGASAQTEVATTRTNVLIQVNYGNGGKIDDFKVSGRFPSGTTYALDYNPPMLGAANIKDGFLFFNANLPAQHITVPAGSVPDIVSGGMGMCASGCTIFGTAVYGAAGDRAQGVTGAFQANTSQFSYPPHSITGTFIVAP